MVQLSCKRVWQEISNYLEDDLSIETREMIEEHLAQCRHCAALLDSTRNVIILIADEKAFELPVGFSSRLYALIAKEIRQKQKR